MPLLPTESAQKFSVSYNSPDIFQIDENKFLVYDRELPLREFKFMELFSFQKK